MKRIGITGQSGFIGLHLFNILGLEPDRYERIIFNRTFFDNNELLDKFVEQCDVIIHLAGMNRHVDNQIIYDTNIEITQKLITSLKRTNSHAHVIFSSSSQEGSNNLYAKSKKEIRKLLSNWADESNNVFTGMIIPNVFGPFCKPYYNSVISTFSHQLTHELLPKIKNSSELKLIYVGELVKEIIKVIEDKISNHNFEVCHTSEINVAEILSLLEEFTSGYLKNGIIPLINTEFRLNLFNTYRSYIDMKDRYPQKINLFTDSRGSFAEVIRLNIGGQVSFSTTVRGNVRGNHFHTRKLERFTVIKGKALIQLRRIGTEEVIELYLDGDEPSYVDMPIWYVHNIKNISDEELYTIFWINEFYNPDDPDTYFEVV